MKSIGSETITPFEISLSSVESCLSRPPQFLGGIKSEYMDRGEYSFLLEKNHVLAGCPLVMMLGDLWRPSSWQCAGQVKQESEGMGRPYQFWRFLRGRASLPRELV